VGEVPIRIALTFPTSRVATVLLDQLLSAVNCPSKTRTRNLHGNKLTRDPLSVSEDEFVVYIFDGNMLGLRLAINKRRASVCGCALCCDMAAIDRIYSALHDGLTALAEYNTGSWRCLVGTQSSLASLHLVAAAPCESRCVNA